jgi:superfamily I DNA and RNA helicase
LSYEKWKDNVGAFDFMDVVTHVWKHRHYNYNWRHHYSDNMKFDYLLVDEVQDLPAKAIRLLLFCVTQNVFFAGDTA